MNRRIRENLKQALVFYRDSIGLGLHRYFVARVVVERAASIVVRLFIY